MHPRLLFILLCLLLSRYVSAQDTVHSGRITVLIAEWQQLPRDSNEHFVAAHSYRSQKSPSVFHEDTFIPGSEVPLKSAKVNDVVGPFQKANAEFLLRVDSIGITCDSVQASHILIAWNGSASSSAVTRKREQAKQRADSLCSLIRSGAAFESFVVPGITEDPGSLQGNQGNYGWFTRATPFVDEFINGAFSHAVGETFVFESAFGFHIMQVKAKTKEYESVFAWAIVKLIDTCYAEDGVTQVIRPGGYPGGTANLDRVLAKRRTQYPSIAKPNGSGNKILVSFDVLPNGTVNNVQLQFAEALSPRQRIEVQKLFLSLSGFIPRRTCSATFGYTETYFFEI